MAEKAEKKDKDSRYMPEFTKEQILASARFNTHRDLVEALLDPKKKYTMETVDEAMKEYLKGQVK